MTDRFVNAARLMAQYAKSHHAGQFGSPLARDLAATPGDLAEWPGTVAVIKTLRADSTRVDWTGRKYRLPKGATVATFVARDGRSPVPQALDTCDYLTVYAEDFELCAEIERWRRPRIATRISASSEIITTYGPRGTAAYREALADRPVAPLIAPPAVPRWPSSVRAAIEREVKALQQWHDDYPFYSDGTWGAVNLRGFDPTDPLWGVKPAEMPKTWHAEHPGALARRCDWTTICDVLPTVRAIVEDVGWWTNLERVRLLRMAAKPGGGRLARHSDVTDRSAGTRDGQVCRFFIPIVTHPDVTMTTWDLDGHATTRHLAAWNVYYLDQRKPHAVHNPTNVDRIQLSIDVLATPEVRRHLEAASS